MLTLLRHPGTKPLVEQGVPREMASHTLDSYRDNWWCTTCFRENQVEVHTAWISKEEAAQGKAEAEALGKNLAGPVFLGRAVIAYARAHPEDKDVPEALALTVRATRYGWTDQKIVDGGANSVVSKQAFLLLHKKYPGSPWTAKTKYYY